MLNKKPIYTPTMLDEQDKQRLDEMLEVIELECDRFLGYPCTRDFDYSPLFPFFYYRNVILLQRDKIGILFQFR